MNGIFKLGWSDLAKGLIVAILTGVLTYGQQAVANATLDFAALNWSTIGGVAAAGAVGYLLKNLLSDNDGKFVGRVG